MADTNSFKTKICIVDSSLITCTLLYRRIEHIMQDAKIIYHIDPCDLVFNELCGCDLIVIDELLTHLRGIEVINELYDYMYNSLENKDELQYIFPKIIFSSGLTKEQIIDRLKEEGVYDKIPNFEIVEKPIAEGVLEEAIYKLCPLNKLKTSFKTYSSTSSFPSIFNLFLYGLKEIFSF